MRTRHLKGVTVIEILFALVILAAMAGAVYSLMTSISITEFSNERIGKAVFYLQEGDEILRAIGQEDITNLDTSADALSRTDDTYSLVDSGGTGENLGSGFTRHIEISYTPRDYNYEYSDAGIFTDYSTRATEVRVEWTELGVNRAVSSHKVLHNLDGYTWAVSDLDEFAAGDLSASLETSFTDDNPLASPGDGVLQLASGQVSGTYTSEVFDSGAADAVFSRINAVSYLPDSDNILLQTRTAADAANIEDKDFTGPDGTTGTYYTGAYELITVSSPDPPDPEDEICVGVSDKEFYASLTPGASGTYPAQGSESDTVNLTSGSPISEGYLNVPLDFTGIPDDFGNARIQIEFDDLDIQVDTFNIGGKTVTIQERFQLQDEVNDPITTLRETYPADDDFTWTYNLADELFTDSDLSLTGRIETTVELLAGSSLSISNGSDGMNDIEICGEIIDEATSNQAQFLQWRAFFTGDSVTAPMLDLVTIYYYFAN